MVKTVKDLYLQKVATWYRSREKFETVLSDDVDGLVSTSILKFAKNWNVEYFYDFNTLYASNNVYFKDKKSATRVWADVSIVVHDAMTFDNHVNRMNLQDYTNPNAINPNILDDITNQNYYNKYAGSTALLIWDLYKIPLPTTEEGKMLLLCIDSTFKGFFVPYKEAREACRHFLCDVMDMEELYEVLKHHTSSEFYQMINKYELNKKIWVNADGQLQTNLNIELLTELLEIPVELPTLKMNEYMEFESKFAQYYGTSIKNIKGVATLALTGKNKCSYSVVKKKTK